jgi:hypothetical protein
MKTILLLLVVACISAVFYFSWLPNPDLCTENYLPKWLLDWSNTYYNLRTAVPFLALGFLLELGRRQKKIMGKTRNALRLFVENTAISLAVVCVAEGGQFILQNRNPDLRDVVYGVLGSGIGSLGYYCIKYCINSKNKAHAQ